MVIAVVPAGSRAGSSSWAAACGMGEFAPLRRGGLGSNVSAHGHIHRTLGWVCCFSAGTEALPWRKGRTLFQFISLRSTDWWHQCCLCYLRGKGHRVQWSGGEGRTWLDWCSQGGGWWGLPSPLGRTRRLLQCSTLMQDLCEICIVLHITSKGTGKYSLLRTELYRTPHIWRKLSLYFAS